MTEPTTVTADLLREWQLEAPGSSKDARGAALVVGGSSSTPGAVILAGESALRAGGGKLQVATARSTAGQVSLALPEALVRGFPETDSGDVDESACDDVFEMARGAAVTLLGPGLLNPEHAADLLDGVVPRLEGPVVIDALGSAYITRHPEGLHHLDGRAVLTLNHDELAHCLDVEVNAVQDDPVRASADLAARTRSVVLCGGPEKFVLTPGGDCYRITEGGPGLGTSGSGDVQAGLVTGLLARGADPVQAAVWGAFLHGAAGDRLAQECGHVGFLAREIAGVVPRLLTWLST
jgi:ADP-dependent NAD(P)H-hydrate dehydratase